MTASSDTFVIVVVAIALEIAMHILTPKHSPLWERINILGKIKFHLIFPKHSHRFY